MSMTGEALQKLFESEFQGMAKLSLGQEAIWDEVLAKVPYVPVGYTRASLEYQHAYMSAFLEELVDFSVIIYQKNRPIGVWPLSLRKKDGVYEFATNQGAVLPPVFVAGTSERLIKKYDTACLDAMKGFYNALKEKISLRSKWKTRVDFLQSELLGQSISWEQKCMLLKAVPRVVHDLYVDLSWPLDKIHGNLRKSYRSLINEGERIWQVEVHDQVSEELFEEFRCLHIAVAGRETRPKITWDFQRKGINEALDFLVTVRDSEQKLCGAGLFEVSRDEGSYAVGAYDRSLFDKPVSHVVQWTAIRHLQELGKRWHYVGQRFYDCDVPVPTPKEMQIAYFKEGFATDTVLRLMLEMDLEEAE
ncbi:MAG: FemAB family protein [Anaerovibrio sp.]|uniref:FemAB family protein n=1 Tax=Anaerovibrio sp. TaxID=1872532 RepID=UPI0025F883F2|nr:FemAB family protein [Anaerovibrio sp.]MCR5176143.1 FemAB family protein [Anaerovibrio sp.]